MARLGTADLLRAVPGAPDPDAGESRPDEGADWWGRRRAVPLGPGHVAPVPRTPPAARAQWRRWSRLYLGVPGRHPLADLRRARGIKQPLRRGRTRTRFRCNGRDHP